MLGKKVSSIKKLAKKVKVKGGAEQLSEFRRLPRECNRTPAGFLAIYVGEEKQRFVVATKHLSHPLFKMLLEKACNEFGFGQRGGLSVPCSVAAFQEVLSAVKSSHGKFDLKNLVEEFV